MRNRKEKMDYLLFYSQYSTSSKKILDQFPNLLEKSVCVDSTQMKKHIKKLSIICVPTLVIIMNGKIIERIVGYEKIYNWILITLYRIDQIQPQEDNTQPPPNIQQSVQQQTSIQPQQTSIQPQQSMSIQPQSQQPQNQYIQIPQQDIPQVPQEIHSTPDYEVFQGQTSLDDLVLEDIQEDTPRSPTNGGGGSTMQLAEALKKERDNLDPKSKKKFITDRGGN